MEEIEKNPARKILVVDDNKDSRELVAKVLKAKGYMIIEAADGEDALQKAGDETPDLILMDISIPKIDGYEATRILKSRNDCKDIPVVALTAHAMKGDMEKAISAGCDGYIPKPVDTRELPNQVKDFLDRRRR